MIINVNLKKKNSSSACAVFPGFKMTSKRHHSNDIKLTKKEKMKRYINECRMSIINPKRI